MQILPITSGEHREFVEQNYPFVKAGTALEFPRLMAYRETPSSVVQYFRTALVECIIKQFEDGRTHTVFLSALMNDKEELLVTDDGRRAAEMELRLFGFT